MHNEMNITVREAYKNASQESRIFQKNYSFYRRLYGKLRLIAKHKGNISRYRTVI